MTQFIKLCYRNILETGTLSVTSEDTDFPKYRLYDRDIGRLFKGDSFPPNFNITLNQGAVTSYEIDRLLIPAGHNLNTLALKLQYGTSNFPISTVTIGAPGSGYQVDDILTIVQAGASGGQVRVTGIGGSGEVTSVSIEAAGTGYSVENVLATTGGSGSACTINVTVVGATNASSWTQSGSALIDKEFTAQTKQYWRLNIAAPASAPELAEMFLTKSYELERNANYGCIESYRDNVYRDEAQSGIVYKTEMGDIKKYRKYFLTRISAAQKTNLEAAGLHLDITLKPLYLEDLQGLVFFAELLKALEFTMEREDRYGTEIEALEMLGATT